MIASLRSKLTYANVTATLALFIALGGSSYAALKLPRNSVGPDQIRSRAVGPSELRTSAVSSRSIRDRSIEVRDIKSRAREALRGPQGPTGPQGPPGPTFHAAVNSTGVAVRGNATSFDHSPPGVYNLGFGRDVSACEAVATLARVDGGGTVDPPAGRITVRPGDQGRITVLTYDENGVAKDLPFNVIVGC